MIALAGVLGAPLIAAAVLALVRDYRPSVRLNVGGCPPTSIFCKARSHCQSASGRQPAIA